VRQTRRPFIAADGGVLSSSDIYDWTYARRRHRMPLGLYWSVLRILRVIADPVGRADSIGRPILWKLRLRNSEPE
jgi:hypothetical protein